MPEQVYCDTCLAMTAPEGSKEYAALNWNTREGAEFQRGMERAAEIAGAHTHYYTGPEIKAECDCGPEVAAALRSAAKESNDG